MGAYTLNRTYIRICFIDDLLFFCSQWGGEFSLYMESNLNYDMSLDLSDFAIFAAHWLEGTP